MSDLEMPSIVFLLSGIIARVFRAYISRHPAEECVDRVNIHKQILKSLFEDSQWEIKVV